MKSTFKVITQSPVVQVTRQDGTQTSKSTIMLQEVGGKYEDSFAAVLLGNMASLKFYQNDIVFAALRFSAREYNGNLYMDCNVQDIIKFSTSNAF